MCGEWARSDFERKAIGVDLDAPTLRWGRQNNLADVGDRYGGDV